MRVTAFQHPRPARRPQAAAPPPGPRRPQPSREGHRPDQAAAARLHPKPDLVRHRRARRRTDPLAADPRPDRTPGPPRGTETAHRAAPVPTHPLGRPAHRRDHHTEGTPRARLNHLSPSAPDPRQHPAAGTHPETTSGALSHPNGTIITHGGHHHRQTPSTSNLTKDPG